jgi:hypothetical protein
MRKVWLPKDSLFRMEGNCQGRVILCQAGVCWVTQEGDPQDHLLEAGERLIIDRAGLVVVQGITDGAICLETSPCLPNDTGVRERFPGGAR